MIRVIVALALVSTISGVRSTNGADGLDKPHPGIPTPAIGSSVFPLDPDVIWEITPLGNMNPAGGHVFPTDHIYLNYGSQPGLMVLAPAAGTVIAVRDQLRGDSKVEIRFDENLSYYLAHLDLQAGIAAGSKVSAGQTLGRTSGRSMLDLGATDARVHLTGFVNPDRYPQPTLHAISPLALFAEPLRSRLYSKVNRKGVDKDGKIDFDKPGRLVGNWFHDSLPVGDSSRGEAAVWAKQLSFAYDVHDPSAVRISIGGTIAPAGLYGVEKGVADPAEVGLEIGLVKYRLKRVSRDRSGRSENDAGLLLVQLLSEHTLKTEYFGDRSSVDVIGFEDKAQVYKR